MKCSAIVETDFDIKPELMQESLSGGEIAKAYAGREVVHEEDVLELVIGDLVDVDLSGQVSS